MVTLQREAGLPKRQEGSFSRCDPATLHSPAPPSPLARRTPSPLNCLSRVNHHVLLQPITDLYLGFLPLLDTHLIQIGILE